MVFILMNDYEASFYSRNDSALHPAGLSALFILRYAKCFLGHVLWAYQMWISGDQSIAFRSTSRDILWLSRVGFVFLFLFH